MLSAQPALTPAELRGALIASTRPFPASGAGNDENGQPVPMCRAPDGSDQLQCYCSAGLCGAGMVDALGAVTAALATIARIELEPAVVQPGDNLRLSADGSLVSAGRSIVGYSWLLIDGGGVVSGFAGASNAAEAFVVPSGEGSFVVQLTVDDDGGGQASVQRTVTVAAATPAPPPAASAPAASSGGGGSSLRWVLLLALAVVSLRGSELVSKRSPPGG
jgi:serine protease